MDEKFEEILDNIPNRRQRSKLEPYDDLIDELRRRGHTFRGIAQILAERCELVVVSSTVVRFVATRSKRKRKCLKFPDAELTRVKNTATAPERVINSSATPSSEVWKRIEALKQRPAQTVAPTRQFDYDPNQPLRLQPKTGKHNPNDNT